MSINYVNSNELQIKTYSFEATFGSWEYDGVAGAFYPADKDNNIYANTAIGLYNELYSTAGIMDMSTFLDIYYSKTSPTLEYQLPTFWNQFVVIYRYENDDFYNIIFSGHITTSLINNTQNFIKIVHSKSSNSFNLHVGTSTVNGNAYSYLVNNTVKFTIRYS